MVELIRLKLFIKDTIINLNNFIKNANVIDEKIKNLL